MIIPLSYCSAASGLTVDLDYNDATHAIDAYDPAGASCSPGLTYGTAIYSHDDGGTTYTVRVQNTAPYAYVTSAPTVVPCTVTIDSVDITNASTNESSDGVITINVTASHVALLYSIDDGLNYQSSNVFTGLAQGTYNIRVRNKGTVGEPDSPCFDTTTATVEYDAVVCELELGQIQQTNSPGGTISVVSVVDPIGLPVEYRLDAGAWQASPVFTGLAAATYSVQVRYVDFTSCSDSRNVTIDDGITCDLQLQLAAVTNETEKYADDGTITITATSSNGPIEYSKDDGSNYQASNIFTGLSPGTYPIRVKDAVSNCEQTTVAVVKAYKVALVEFPIANPLRVVLTGGPSDVYNSSAKQNFDNRLFAAMRFPGIEPGCYSQKYQASDSIIYQWRSSYEAHTVKIYNAVNDSLVATLNPVKRTAYLNKSETLAAEFSDAGANQTQVYFPDTGLPAFFEIGQDITISGQVSLNGTYEVVDILPGILEAEGNIVLIINKEYTSGTDPLGGNVAITYQQEDYEVWEVPIDMAAFTANGTYYMVIAGTDEQFSAFSSKSEPFQPLTDVSDLVKLIYYNLENAFKIEYTTGIQMLCYFEGAIFHGQPGGEREEMEDSRNRSILLRENVTRNPRLEGDELPPYLAEKIRLAMAHDYKTLDGVQYEKSADVDVEYHERDAFASVDAKLRQVDFIAENADDQGDVDGVVLELGDGEIMQLEP